MICVNVPCYSDTSGGIKRMLELSEELFTRHFSVHLHFDKLNSALGQPILPFAHSVGAIDKVTPAATTVITYSDTPHINAICDKFKKTLVYQLSYGMAPERERAVVKHRKTTILCSTQHIVDRIRRDGITKKCYKIGVSLERQVKNFYPVPVAHVEGTAVMYHKSKLKGYDIAIQRILDYDLPKKRIVVFGDLTGYKPHEIVTEAYHKPSFEQLRQIFSSCSLYYNCSQSEGLNLTPIESALCGCQTVYCDGDREILSKMPFRKGGTAEGAEKQRKRFLKHCKKYTWKKVINKLTPHLWGL